MRSAGPHRLNGVTRVMKRGKSVSGIVVLRAFLADLRSQLDSLPSPFR